MKNLKFFFIFLIFLFFQIGTSELLVYSHPGLDSSWSQALLLAIKNKEVFGSDFAFNYGPWGYLNFRTVNTNFGKWLVLVTTIFTAFNFFHFWKLLIEKYPSDKLFFSCLFLFLLIPFGLIGDFSFTYFFFLILWLYQGISRSDKFSFNLSGIIVTLLFFVKLNLNLVAIILYVCSIIIAYFYSTFSKRILGGLLIGPFVLIILFSSIFHVDLIKYCQLTFLLIDSYADGMSEIIFSNFELLSFGLLECLMLGLIIRFLWKHFTWGGIELYFLGICAFMLFFVHKQSHTAISLPNEYGFLNFFPWLFLFILLILPNTNHGFFFKKYLFSILFLTLIGQQYFWHNLAYRQQRESFYYFKTYKFQPIQHLLTFVNYQLEQPEVNEKPLPADMLQVIKKGSVDIFPSEIDYIYFNQLKYNHRPVVQSYAASNNELIEINAAKFKSADAPDFVIYKLESFRRQNPIWVETNSMLEILRHYDFHGQYVAGTDSLILLKKDSHQIAPTVVVKNFGISSLNKEIKVPQVQGVLVGKFDFQYSVLGKLSKLLFQPPYLFCRVTYSNGVIEQFRVIPAILKSGIILNKKITAHHELKTFFKFKGEKNVNVTSVYFSSPVTKGFVDPLSSN